jgi:hypothetical protein
VAFLITWRSEPLNIGDEWLFKIRQGKRITWALGKIASMNKVTLDGLRIVEVRFKDKIRKYSLDYIV